MPSSPAKTRGRDSSLIKNSNYFIDPLSRAGYQVALQVVEARTRKNLTQAQLAEKIGTDQAVISRLENMKVKPSITLLEKVARALNSRIIVTI